MSSADNAAPGVKPERFTLLSPVAFAAASVAVKQHPNKMPFSGVLTYLDEPSDAPPGGSAGGRVMLTTQAAERSIDSLIGMGLDCRDDFAGHDAQQKIGVIAAARIEQIETRKAIVVDGYIFANDFPELAKEIKANKEQLGMSFEASDLWTPNPKANPISIIECTFTGAAILFKDKAAYRTTSISAAAKAAIHQEEVFSMPMDNETKEQLTAIVAAAIKPVADAVAAQGTEIAELKKLPEKLAEVSAANNLDKVEPHAKRVEDAANKMEEDGIGGHPTSGHVAFLRRMAGSIRADGAEGKMPHVFDRFSASADNGEAEKKAVETAVAKVTAESNAKIETMKAEAAKVEKEHKDALASEKTKVADLTAKVAKLEASATKPKRETLSNGHIAALEKAGIKLPEGDAKLDPAKVSKMFAEAGIADPQKRMELKNALHAIGVLD